MLIKSVIHFSMLVVLPFIEYQIFKFDEHYNRYPSSEIRKINKGEMHLSCMESYKSC